jgi:hypothetical protein
VRRGTASDCRGVAIPCPSFSWLLPRVYPYATFCWAIAGIKPLMARRVPPMVIYRHRPGRKRTAVVRAAVLDEARRGTGKSSRRTRLLSRRAASAMTNASILFPGKPGSDLASSPKSSLLFLSIPRSCSLAFFCYFLLAPACCVLFPAYSLSLVMLLLYLIFANSLVSCPFPSRPLSREGSRNKGTPALGSRACGAIRPPVVASACGLVLAAPGPGFAALIPGTLAAGRGLRVAAAR